MERNKRLKKDHWNYVIVPIVKVYMMEKNHPLMHMMLHGRMAAKVHSIQSILHCGNVQLSIHSTYILNL